MSLWITMVILAATEDSQTGPLWEKENISLDRGKLYRLQFDIKTDDLCCESLRTRIVNQQNTFHQCRSRRLAKWIETKNLVVTSFRGIGQEGPAWLMKVVEILKLGGWQCVEVLFRAQVAFNPIEKVTARIDLHNGKAEIRNVHFAPMPDGKATDIPVTRWLKIKTHDQLCYSDIELGLGVGIATEDGSVELFSDGRQLMRVSDIDSIKVPGQFAFK